MSKGGECPHSWETDETRKTRYCIHCDEHQWLIWGRGQPEWKSYNPHTLRYLEQDLDVRQA
jgi:hypothetical protein